MKITQINSSDNQRLKIIRGLAQTAKRKDISDKHDLILLEGQKLMQEAISKQIKLYDIIASETYYQANLAKTKPAINLESVVVVKDDIFKELYSTDTSCGIIATASPKHYSLDDIIANSKLILLADNIQDPGNLGTIIRTALAFDVGGLLLSKGSVDCYNPKVIRSSMGGIFSLPIINNIELVSVIGKMKENNFRVIALDSGAKETIWESVSYATPMAYILGNEGHGISEDVLRAVDDSISIPINPNCESLNVAIAAGIILAFSKFKSGR